MLLLVACGQPSSGEPGTIAADGSTIAPDSAPCSTKISYANNGISPANHAAFDLVDGAVTWDGTCIDDGESSYAVLSNGWKPYFVGNQACTIALDYSAGCGAPTTCETRVTYASSWLHPQNHTAQYDDVAGRVFWDGACRAAGSDSVAELSNGWQPHFSGASSCGISQRWTSCGGLYANSVLGSGCADPGVVRDGDRYVMSCTSGNAANAFPLYVSHDLVTWTAQGHILPSAARPAWAKSDFWAPEIHHIGNKWLAYWSARGSDGKLAIGAASADDPLGPYTALAQPIVPATTVGLIDATAFVANGTAYLAWKEDGNAQSAPTPIRARQLAANGLSLTGGMQTLITNTLAWEGNLVEGPFVVEHGGMFYLFYSGNAYYDGRYAVGVARASSPLGPYTKAAAPIVVTGGAWVGPGHNSVVDGPGGDSYLVYHAWQLGHVNGPGDSRKVLVDQLVWRDGWPALPGGPSSTSRPLP
ncbi:MAG TPA: glycoside hydrolase family 43 protein [Kofleriaceae bacterium]